MKYKTKFATALLVTYFSIANVIAQSNITHNCGFTNVLAARWTNGDWVSARLLPKPNQFLIKVENGSIDVRSIAEHFGGWGGMDVACSYIDSVDNESKHFRCLQKNVTSKMLIFNPNTKNGALVTPDGAWFSDAWKLKDDVGIEFFKCK